MKRIRLLAFAIASIVAFAPIGSQAQVVSQAPAPTEASRNCDQCKQLAESCQNQKTPGDRAQCQAMAMQCRCSK